MSYEVRNFDWKFLWMKCVKKGRKRSWDMQPWKRQSTSKDCFACVTVSSPRNSPELRSSSPLLRCTWRPLDFPFGTLYSSSILLILEMISSTLRRSNGSLYRSLSPSFEPTWGQHEDVRPTCLFLHHFAAWRLMLQGMTLTLLGGIPFGSNTIIYIV